MTNRFEVVKTPTKLDLARALLDRKPLDIKVAHGGGTATIKVILNSITAEDGSAESWILKGYHHRSNGKFEAWLRTNRDEGWAKLEAPT